MRCEHRRLLQKTRRADRQSGGVGTGRQLDHVHERLQLSPAERRGTRAVRSWRVRVASVQQN